MSTRSKGRNAEKEVAGILKQRGYKVQLVPGSQKWNKQVDFFDGMFDIFGYNKENFIFVQVKSNRTGGWVKKAMEWLKNENMPGNSIVELWVRYDNKPIDKRFKVHKL